MCRKRGGKTRMKIEIREYEEQDWMRLMEVHDSARMQELEYAGIPEAFLSLNVAAEREGLFDYQVDVAVVDGELAGFAAYNEEELGWLYVDTEYHRQGIGQRLIRHVLERTTYRPLTIEVLAGNEPAKRLYEKMGFKETKKLAGVMPGNEKYQVTVYRMECYC